jgi:hypothetical protein
VIARRAVGELADVVAPFVTRQVSPRSGRAETLKQQLRIAFKDPRRAVVARRREARPVRAERNRSDRAAMLHPGEFRPARRVDDPHRAALLRKREAEAIQVR